MAEVLLCCISRCGVDGENPETPYPGTGRGLKRTARAGTSRKRVAITGMSIINSLGKSPEEVWAASLAMKERDHLGSAFSVGSRAFL